jgi:tetratricopeptide (TPR) repeat protein
MGKPFSKSNCLTAISVIMPKFLFPFLIIILFFLSDITPGNAQNSQPDSISKAITATTGKERAKLLLFFSRQALADDPEKSLEFARQAEILAKSKNSLELISDALKIQGDALFELDSLKSAAFAYSMAVETEDALPNQRPDTLMRRLSDVGFAFQEMGLFDKALEYFQRALPISRAQNDSVEIVSNLSNIGVSLKMLGRYGEAIEVLNQTLELDKLMGSESDMAIDYNNIGMVYKSWNNYDKAIEFFNKALQIDEKLGNRHKLSIRLSNIGQVYLSWGKTSEAIDYFNKALQIDKELNVPGKIAIRLHGLGLAYMSLNEFQKAIQYFEESLKTYKSLNIEYQTAIVLESIGDAYNELGQFNLAEKYYNESLSLSQSINLKPTIIEAARNLYELFKTQKNYQKSLQYFEIFKVAEDSVFSEASARQINEFEIRYETEKKENENQLLTKDIQIKERNQWFLLTLIIALIVLSASLFYAFSLKRKSLRQSRILYEKENELTRLKIEHVEKQNHHLQEVLFAEEEIKKLQLHSIEQKNHELTSATLLIASKNEAFENLQKMAEQIRLKSSDDGNEKIREMIREINRQTDVESQWEQFRVHFESIHKSFFVKLRENTPGLTQTDLQLCAYIKLNMATKEISKLLNITPESVNTHRYRLRKKMELSGQETLDEFIHGL